MSRVFEDVSNTDYIDTGLLRLLERDRAALSTMSGYTTFTSPIQYLFYLNLATKTLNTLHDSKDDVVIDFSHRIANSDSIKRLMQPLNENLTRFSGVSVSGQGLISHNAFVTMSKFFNNDFKTENVTECRNSIGLGELALQNKIDGSDIPDNELTLSKFKASILVDDQFSTGDIFYSYRNDTRNGCLLLGDGFTMGGNLSGGTYRNVAYKELFSVLWQNPDAILYTSTGNLTTKGENAESDFNANKRILLPRKLSLFNQYFNQSLSPTVSTPLTFTVETPSYFEIIMSGASGGYANGGETSGTNSYYHLSSGGGAAFAGIVYLKRGTYKCTMGKAGYGGNGGYAGTNSTFVYVDTNTTLINAGGGGLTTGSGNSNGWYAGSPVIGAGGTLTVNTNNGGVFTIHSTTVQGDGNAGHAELHIHSGTSTAPAVKSLLEDKYGITNGGVPSFQYGTSNVYAGTNYTGTNGYFSIRDLGPRLNDTNALQKVYDFLRNINAYIGI